MRQKRWFGCWRCGCPSTSDEEEGAWLGVTTETMFSQELEQSNKRKPF
jgi:3'-phosphoadenosine 5'-phosphosulfate sulfotransferase (PAPS reductase)/FAD synthetase